MKHQCIASTLGVYRALIPKKGNENLLFNLAGLCDGGDGEWYRAESPLHRAYMRLMQVEARNRALDHTSVTGLR